MIAALLAVLVALSLYLLVGVTVALAWGQVVRRADELDLGPYRDAGEQQHHDWGDMW